MLTGSPGTASVIAQAIDESSLHEQEGTLAGDNTLLVLFADESRLGALARSLHRPSRPRSGGSSDPDEEGRPRLLRRARHVGRRRLAARAVRCRGGDPHGRRRRRVAPRRASSGGRCPPARRGPTSSTRASGSSPTSCGRTSRPTRCTRAPIRWPPRSPGRSSRSSSSRSPQREGADAVAHGCTGKGNDQVRFDVADPRARSGARGHRPDARRDGPDPRPGDRLRDRARDRDPDHQGVALFDRRQPLGPVVRDGRARGSVGHAARRRLRVDGRRRPTRPTRSRSRSSSRAASRSPIDGERLLPVDARRARPRAGRRARRRADRPRRGPPGRDQEPRDLRGAGGDDPARRASGARGADAVAATRSGSTGWSPTSWPG